MRLSHLLSKSLCMVSGAALLLAVLPTTTEAAAPAYAAMTTSTPLFLQPSSPPTPWVPNSSTPSNRGGALPNSTLPVGAFVECSAQTAVPTDVCSTLAGVARCSTQCDSGNFLNCSAKPGVTGVAKCSTIKRSTACSVLSPSNGDTAPTVCSAFVTQPGQTAHCSTLTTHVRQACSVENTGDPVQQGCSSLAFGQEAPCSVLASGARRRSACTAFFDGGKQCSAFDFAQPAPGCSVLASARGVCTALKGAPSGSCSALNPNTFCSVLGGAPGTDRCVSP